MEYILNPWYYISASFFIALGGMLWLLIQSWQAAKRAELGSSKWDDKL